MGFEISSVTRLLSYVGLVQQTGAPQSSAPQSSMSSPSSCGVNSDAPKSLLEVLNPDQIQTCVETYPVALNIKESGTIRFKDGVKVEFNFGRLVDEKKLLWKLDALTWEDVASIVYPQGTDPKTAAAELMKVNGKVGSPYELITDGQSASYRYLRLAKGESFLRWVSCPLPNFGSVPVIPVNVPELPIDKCSGIRAEIAKAEQSIKDLQTKLDEKIAFVQGKVYRDVVLKTKLNSNLFVVFKYLDAAGIEKLDYDADAIDHVNAIKINADGIIAQARAILGNNCQDTGDILKALADVELGLTNAIANLNFIEKKPKTPQIRTPGTRQVTTTPVAKPTGKKTLSKPRSE